jgi:hypothetical protein
MAYLILLQIAALRRTYTDIAALRRTSHVYFAQKLDKQYLHPPTIPRDEGRDS